MRFFIRLLAVLLTALHPAWLLAQSSDQAEMATGLRSNGLIWIVVGVILIILFGLLLYLYNLDRRITNMEKEQ